MRKNELRERAMEIVFFLSAMVSIVAVLLICVFLFAKGFPAIKEIFCSHVGTFK